MATVGAAVDGERTQVAGRPAPADSLVRVTTDTRQRLAREVRRSDADLAELALCVCAEHDPDVDVDAWLLRIDALADGLRTTTELSGRPEADALALADYLGRTRGFGGDVDDYYDPANGLLTEVLERHRGLPITLSILYVAIARRVGLPAWGIGLPGHYYVGIGTPDRPVVLDPFDGGAVVGHDELGARVRAATAGQVELTRAHLRAAGPAPTIRRVLDNLTRDFTNRGDVDGALASVECKLVLPNAQPDDHRTRGELLGHLGRYRQAADAFETYLGIVGPGAVDADDVRAQAVRARAKLN